MKDLDHHHHHHPSAASGSSSATVATASVSMPELPAVVNYNKLLGSGCYAKVYGGHWNGLEVAVKVPLGARAADRDRTRQEIRLWRRMSHPNISQFFCEYANREGTQIHIVSELADGDLASRVLRSKEDIPLLHRLHWARDVLEGLRHMHSHHMVHRDLKLVNVLYLVPNSASMATTATAASTMATAAAAAAAASTTMTPPLPIAKLTDFGMCQMIPVSCGYLIDPPRRPLGTPLYMAPEALTGGRITTKVDIYSFGMLLWELVMRSEVFKHMTEYHAFVRAVVGGERPPLDALPHESLLRPLLTACWELNAKKRPTADEALVMLQQAIDALTPCPVDDTAACANNEDDRNSLTTACTTANNSNNLQPHSNNCSGIENGRPVSPLPSRTASPALRASPGMAVPAAAALAAAALVPVVSAPAPLLAAPVPCAALVVANACAALEAAATHPHPPPPQQQQQHNQLQQQQQPAAALQLLVPQCHHAHPHHHHHPHHPQHKEVILPAAVPNNSNNANNATTIVGAELAKPASSKQRACWREPMSPSRMT